MENYRKFGDKGKINVKSNNYFHTLNSRLKHSICLGYNLRSSTSNKDVKKPGPSFMVVHVHEMLEDVYAASQELKKASNTIEKDLKCSKKPQSK